MEQEITALREEVAVLVGVIASMDRDIKALRAALAQEKLVGACLTAALRRHCGEALPELAFPIGGGSLREKPLLGFDVKS